MAQAAAISMVYNEYGELVDRESLNRAPIASELTTTEILRILKKAYHHHVRSTLRGLNFASVAQFADLQTTVQEYQWGHRNGGDERQTLTNFQRWFL